MPDMKTLSVLVPLALVLGMALPASADPVCAGQVACFHSEKTKCEKQGSDQTAQDGTQKTEKCAKQCVAVAGGCLEVAPGAPPCNPVEFTGGQPALKLWPFLNVVDIQPSCLLSQVGFITNNL